MMEGHSKSTIYDIIKRKENNIHAERNVGSCHPAKKMNQKVVKRLTGRLNHKNGISQHSLAKSLKVSPSYVNYVIKNKTNIRYRKKTWAERSYSSKM